MRLEDSAKQILVGQRARSKIGKRQVEIGSRLGSTQSHLKICPFEGSEKKQGTDDKNRSLASYFII
jgi:hypothetical protein